MAHVDAEIASQPDCWARAVEIAPQVASALPRPGERVAVVGCGTSWFMAMAYAALRESCAQGETDAFAASEFPTGRNYDRIVAITRSGTTTEVLALLAGTGIPTTAIVGDPDSPAVTAADRCVLLPFADEQSVVQTRFATTALTLLRAHLGADLTGAIADARRAVHAPLPLDPAGTEQVTFLGRGWTVGLAYEAALKCREAATLWTEAYPAMDYRHGPISIAAPGRAVWAFGAVPDGLPDSVHATGATFIPAIPAATAADRSGPEGWSGPEGGPGPEGASSDGAGLLDPVAELILAQRFAVAVAAVRGLDPDNPRALTRSVILT